jgi:hypothetical protein
MKPLSISCVDLPLDEPICRAAALAVVSTVAFVTAHRTPPWRTLTSLTVAGLLITIGMRRITVGPSAATDHRCCPAVAQSSAPPTSG